MSRAFIKEDADAEQVLVTPRPPLPEGVDNLVTPAGLAALEEELAALQAEAAELAALPTETSGSNAVRRLAALDEEIPALEDRLRSAVLVPTPAPGTDVVQVGATVTVKDAAAGAQPNSFVIVGVDEADPLEGLVAFTAPVAQALLGKQLGATATFTTGDGVTRSVLLVDVKYD
ncbi:MAG: GreA/GreB family elongation factor [Trueperaceae bacterium]